MKARPVNAAGAAASRGNTASATAAAVSAAGAASAGRRAPFSRIAALALGLVGRYGEADPGPLTPASAPTAALATAPASALPAAPATPLPAVLPTAPASAAPPAVLRYTYRIVDRRPLAANSFVQGLQIVGDTLYLGTGQYGASRLREYAFPGMQLRREVALPDELFGEGVTRLGERIYQLTWRSGQVRVYAAASLELLRTPRIATQGWGITHDGRRLYYSDGSATLRVLDPHSLAVQRAFSVTLHGQALPRLNELEWIDGEIWANVWQTEQLVRIDPARGQVRGIVDLRGLLPAAQRRRETGVLNGIAWDEQRRALWVTGKNWRWLYRIRLVALPGAPPGATSAVDSPRKNPQTR